MLKRVYLAAAVILVAAFIFYCSVDVFSLVPDDNMEFAKAEVISVQGEDLLTEGAEAGSQEVLLSVKSGSHKGETMEAYSMNGYLYGAYCTPGEKVIVCISTYEGTASASVYNYDRELPIGVLVVMFLAAMWLVGGKRGIHSIVALLFTFAIIILLYLPMLYIGCSPFLAAVVSVVLITVISILLIGDISVKSFCAVVGTICGVVVAGIIAQIFGTVAHISGYSVSEIETLVYIGQHSSLQISGILFSGILISSLGAVMDVAMSVSSALMEINEKSPELPRRELFRSGMHIGRDMIGTMSNTLILAYVGSSVNTLLIIYSYQYSAHQFLNMYSIGIEIMQSISGTLGIILTVPFVSFVSACMLRKR